MSARPGSTAAKYSRTGMFIRRQVSTTDRKKIQTKDEVLAELMAEHIALKKSLGEL